MTWRSHWVQENQKQKPADRVGRRDGRMLSNGTSAPIVCGNVNPSDRPVIRPLSAAGANGGSGFLQIVTVVGKMARPS